MNGTGAATPVEPRAVGAPLMTGLVALPLLFVWFLFLPGYSRSLRFTVFMYSVGPAIAAILLLAVWLLVATLMRLVGA